MDFRPDEKTQDGSVTMVMIGVLVVCILQVTPRTIFAFLGIKEKCFSQVIR